MMSIEWLPLDEFEQRLKRDYPPVELWLREFLVGRLEEGLDLSALISRPPDAVDWFPGLGQHDGWVGIVDGVPFSLAAQRSQQTMRWGFNLSLPVFVRDDGGWDVRAQLQVAAALPAVLRRNDSPWVESLPFAGPGWGIAETGDDEPLFRSAAREDAVALADFLNETHPNGYQVIPLAEPSLLRWVVVGPRTGRFLSSVQVFDSREAAEVNAAKRSAETGVMFTLHAGSITSPA